MRNDTEYQSKRVRWSQKVWYGKQLDMFALKEPRPRSREAELAASETILPSLGFTEIVDLTAILFNSPFDFMATRCGTRCAVEISTKWQKRIETKVALAFAFNFPLQVLLISPRDQRFFHLVEARRGSKTVRVPFELLRKMADFFGEENYVGARKQH